MNMFNLLKLEVKTAPSCRANELRHFPRKLHHGYTIKRYKNASRYNFRTVNAIGFQFSTRHTTSFLCVQIPFGACTTEPSADVTRSDTLRSSKPPQLQVGVFKSRHIRYIGRGVLSLLMCFYSLMLLYWLRRYSCAKLMQLDSHNYCMQLCCK